jgi:hypothetical protein
MTNLNNTFRYRIYDLLGQIKPKWFYVSAMIVALILTTLGANAQPKTGTHRRSKARYKQGAG